MLVEPSAGTPPGPWLRTGDLGVMSDGELFIIGRIKDLLIVDGRNHYPDDIEATIQEITGGRVAAISVPDDQQRAAGRDRGDEEARGSDEEAPEPASQCETGSHLGDFEESHSVRVADLVLVSPGSIPITTSGKIRRSACAERYLQEEFTAWTSRHDLIFRRDRTSALVGGLPVFLETLPREAAKMDPQQSLWRGVVDAYDDLTDDELLQQLSERLG